MRLNQLAATLAAARLAVPGLAMATNGMLLEGYGPVAAGIGGASMAYDNGTATLGLMGEGSRVDVMVGFVGPDVSVSGMMGTSEADAFNMPAIGYVNEQGKLAYGAGGRGQGDLSAGLPCQ